MLIERESLQVFFKETLPSFAARKQRYHHCCGSGRPWYADTRVEWNGLSYRCPPFNQKWTHWASVKYVKKTWWYYFYFSVIKFGIHCIVYLLRIFLNVSQRSRDSSVGIATGYRLDDQGVRVRVPEGSRIFSSHVQTGSGVHPTSYSLGTGGSFSGG
jgi:hypothetical protein